MHTSRTIRTAEFELTCDGARLTFDDVFPDLGTEDRVGIITHTAGGSFAAAPLLLAAIGRFYELHHAEAVMARHLQTIGPPTSSWNS